MKSIFNFIVKPKTNRSTSSKTIEGKELLLNTELQNHNYVSRQGIVLSKPLLGDTNIKKCLNRVNKNTTNIYRHPWSLM